MPTLTLKPCKNAKMFSRRHFLPLFAAAVFVLLSGCGNEAKKALALKTVQDRFAIKVGGQVVQIKG